MLTELSLGLLPLDNDCLSLEYETALRDYGRNDPSPVYAAARALMTWQQMYGTFTNVKVGGRIATNKEFMRNGLGGKI